MRHWADYLFLAWCWLFQHDYWVALTEWYKEMEGGQEMTELKPVVESSLRLRTEIGSGTFGKRKFTIDLNIDNRALFVFFEDENWHVMYPIPFEEMVKEADKLIPDGIKRKKA